MIILYVLLGLVSVIILLLMIPVVISIKFREELELEIRMLFFYKQKLDFTVTEETDTNKAKAQIKPKKKKKKKSSEDTEKDKEKNPQKPEVQFTEILSIITSALETVSKRLEELLRRFLIYDINLFMAICGEDAADTAIKTGQYNAWIYGIYGLLSNFFRTKNTTINISPNFTGEDTEIDFACKVRFIPLLVLITALKIAGKLLIIFIKTMLSKPSGKNKSKPKEKVTERKGGAANEPSN